VTELMELLSVQKRLMGWGHPLKDNLLSEPPVSARVNASHADKQWNTTDIWLTSQQLQCSIKFITTPV